MTTANDNTQAVYGRLMRKIFSGQLPPGTQLVERRLADELGVSRLPVRETLTKMVAQGVLVGGERGQGVRVRSYSAEEVRQLYQFREVIEGGVAYAAAQSATADDLTRLELVCQQMEAEVGNYGSERWADLDHKFHEALASAAHNERFVHSMRTLLAESHYVFYLHPARRGRPQPSPEDATAFMRRVFEDHRKLLDLVRAGDAEGAEATARQHMRQSADRATRALLASDLGAAAGEGSL